MDVEAGHEPHARTPLRKASRLGAVAAGIVAVLVAVVLFLPDALSGRALILDEGAKISESFFASLILRGELRDPAWMATAIDRTNPPVGKVVFGLAMRSAGLDLPPDATMTWRDAEHRFVAPPGREAQFEHLVTPARVVSVVSTAAAFGLVIWLAATEAGWMAALVALIIVGRHYLPSMMAPLAMFDALQSAFIVGAFAVLLSRPRRLRAAFVRVAGSSVLIALAFQTRLNGVLALVGALVIVAFWPLSRTVRLLCATTLGAFTLLIAILVNPYYWGPPESAGGPVQYVSRVVERVDQQRHDVAGIVDSLPEKRIPHVSDKFVILARVLTSGIAGKVAVAGAVMALLAGLLLRDRRILGLVAVAATNALAFGLWLPFAWDRYLLPTVYPLALVAAVGWAGAWEAASRWLRPAAAGGLEGPESQR